MQSNRIITIFGTSKAVPGDDAYELAVRMGRSLAQAGFAIANGGYGGTMMASAQGAQSASGRVYGVTCKAFKRGKANPFITDEVPTENLSMRLSKLVELGDGYVVLPGGTGTLLELAWVWEHKYKKFETAAKPIVVFKPFWQPLMDIMAEADNGCLESILPAGNEIEAVDYLLSFFK